MSLEDCEEKSFWVEHICVAIPTPIYQFGNLEKITFEPYFEGSLSTEKG